MTHAAPGRAWSMTSIHTTRGARQRFRRIALTVVTIALGLPLAVTLSAPAHADSIIAAADNLRTGWYGSEPTLTPAAVGGSTFGQLFSTAITGQVYAQPVIASNTLVVATESNDVYGIDPVTGEIRWHNNYGPGWNPLVLGCGDITPTIGITGTPAIDPATGTAYFFAKTYVSGTSGPAQYVAHAIDVLTGAERAGWPVVVGGVPTNAPGAPFDATYELQRPGLLLMNGVVYAAFGGHCDAGPYRGLVVGINTSGTIETLWASEDANNKGAGIWMSGSPLMSDGPGQIVLATGNGTSPTVGPGGGSTPSIGFGEAALRLTVQPDGSLASTDFFTPYNAESLNGNDQDFGSGGVVGLPDAFGTAAHPHLLVSAGKEGYVYLLDRDNLGGRGSTADNVLGKFGPFGGVWSKPAVWPGDGGYVYLPTASPAASTVGTAGYLRAYRRVVDGAGNPALSLAATSADAYGFGSSPPIVTSNGTQSGTALVWVVHTFDGSGQFAELRAYDALPNGDALTLRFHAPIGTASKFESPVADNGRVYVGTRDGHVIAFGVIGSGPALTGPSLAFSATTVGTTAQASVALTATRAASVTAVSVDNPAFTVGIPTPTLPAALATGDTLTVPVRFTPGQLGPIAGTLSLTTDSGVSTIPITGTGQSPTAPIGASPASVDFGTLPGGSQTVSSSVTFTNTGTTTQTIQAMTLPAAPFGVTGAPPPGTTLAAGASVAMTVTFTPPNQSGTSTTPYSAIVGITTDQTSAAVPLTASTALPPNLVLPASVAFGQVTLNQPVTLSFTVANNGGSPMTILKSKPPVVGGFAATSSLAEGTVIPGGSTLTETVSFTPTAVGPSTATWIITADDDSGVRVVAFTGTGVRFGTVVPPGPAWQLNGSAVMNASTLELTSAATAQAGSAFSPVPVSSASLDVAFTSTVGGGSGADGLTLALLDPADGSQALGASGSGLGFSGLHGLAIAIDTYPNGSVSSFNFVGVAQTDFSGAPGALTFLAVDTNVVAVRGGSHRVHVTVNGGMLTVALDGTTVLASAVTLPPNVLVGFTGSTGGLTDAHSVSDVNIATYVPTPPAAVAAIAGDKQAKVSWSAPADPFVDTYTVTSVPPTTSLTVPASQASATIGGLTNGTTYTFVVHATSSGVDSSDSAPSNAVTPVGPPAAPAGVHAAVAKGAVTVGWSAPDPGGSPTESYTIVASPGGRSVSVDAATRSVTMRGLAAGTYRFKVRATSALGAGAWSSLSNPVTVVSAPGPAKSGYWMLGADGTVYAFGDARQLGRAPGPAIAITTRLDGSGYWTTDAAGTVSGFGTAHAHGARPALATAERVSTIAATPSGNGYWLFTNRGHAFAYGDARSYGDMSGVPLNGPIVASVATPTGHGYYMVGSDGGVFSFGDAHFHGSTGNLDLNRPIVGISPSADNRGYWLVASDGGVFAFHARFRGSMGAVSLARPVNGLVAYGNGYLMVAADGGVFDFSDKRFVGSLANTPIAGPVIGIAAFATT